MHFSPEGAEQGALEQRGELVRLGCESGEVRLETVAVCPAKGGKDLIAYIVVSV